MPAALVVAPGTAHASGLPANLQIFANCPIDNPAVTLCVASETKKTTFEIGSTTVTSTSPTSLSLGIGFNSSGQAISYLPDNGTPALQSPAIPLPGGLLGIPGAPGGGALAVTVTPQLVGTPVLSLAALLSGKGVGLQLPIDIAVNNTLIGSGCTIASATDPVTLNLTTGKTDPPSPNTSIKGKPGKLSSSRTGENSLTGLKLVDNAFAVPGANNCGPGGILDEILDVDKSLPSAAGSNTAILKGGSYTIPASVIAGYLG